MTRRMLLGIVLGAGLLAWPGVAALYSLNGVFQGARAKAATLGFYHHHIIKFRALTCADGFSSGVIVAYRKHAGEDEAQGRLCYKNQKWTWYPSTSDLSNRVPL